MRWGILAFMFSLYIVNFADKSIAGYAAVSISKEFGLSPLQWGIVGSSFFWSFFISNIFGSMLTDKFGTKRMFTVMAFSWTALQFGAFFIHDLTMLIIYRILLGIFEGPFYATAITQLNYWFAPKNRGLATSIFAFGATLGGFVSAPVLVFLIGNFGWRNAFGSLGLVSLVWVLLWLWLGKERPEVSVDPETDRLKSRTVGQPTAKLKVALISMFSITFIFTIFVGFASYWQVAWGQTWLPSFLMEAISLSPSQMSYVIALLGLAGGIVAIIISTISDYVFKKTASFHKARILVTALAVFTGGVLYYSITEIRGVVWVIIAICLAKGMLNSGMVIGSVIAVKLAPERSALMLGLFAGFATMGGIVSPIVTGKMLELGGSDKILGYDYGILIMAAFICVAAILMLLFANPDKVLKKKQSKLEDVNTDELIAK
ncbi:MFS transporter [Bacillus sp. JJ722]|uniref:MFS transporter n=1 Tax=Bacillus sp. JJ722 TaxID=3122973 RepID=UPI002FFF405F